MKHTSINLNLVLLFFVCLIFAGCQGTQTAVSNENAAGQPKTNSANTEGSQDDISSSSTVTKTTPKIAATVAPTQTPKPVKSSNESVANTTPTENKNVSEKPDNPPDKTETPRRYILGPRGNCYFMDGNGKRIFVSKTLCGVGDKTNVPDKSNIPPPPRDPLYTLGPRGNCFYINGTGQKVYVRRNLCSP